MRVSFHPTLMGSDGFAWHELISIASKAGYKAIDLSLPEISRIGINRAQDQLSAAGLEAGGAKLPVEFRKDNDTFNRDLAQLPKYAEAASKLGLTALCRALPASSSIPKCDLAPILRTRIKECANILDSYDLYLGLEFHGVLELRLKERYQFIWTLNETLSFGTSCARNVGVLLDSWHWLHAGSTIEDILHAGPYIVNVEIADALPKPVSEVHDDERLAPGEGSVDLPEFMSAVMRAGYNRTVTPEIFGYRPIQSVTESAATVRKTIEGIINTANHYLCLHIKSILYNGPFEYD